MSANDVSDELAIRNLVGRYADAVTRSDREAWAANWADDGVWRLMGFEGKGRDDVVALLEKLVSGFAFVVQHAPTGVVDVVGDRGTGKWQIVEFGKLKDGMPLLTLGVYDDEYVRERGEWRFASRSFKPVYSGPPDLSGNPIPL